ncbi:MAG TPA: hypothetical protein VEJ36_03630 [Nitrososphaerales archaeon]|nr:hypothetical protein [Nitrososphaerales archaeon]
MRLIDAPDGFTIGIEPAYERTSDAILFFARDSKSVLTRGRVVFDAAKRDELAWIAYPKAGKLDTDLNRDRLRELAGKFGVNSVRLVSLDDTWSAMRFRPV